MLDIALKEWACVCDFLAQGRQAIVLRKGGIHEADGPGVFKLEHDRFAMFPAWEHQKPDWLKPAWQQGVEELQEPAQLPLSCWASVAKVWPVPSREAFDTLDDLHGWDTPQIDMRFSYKPDRPLYLIALRVHRLHTPMLIDNHSAYSGCVSWVPLRDRDVIDEAKATPAIADDAFEAILARCDQAMA